MKNKGVTLVELLVVFVIIAILAALVTPNIGQWVTRYRLRTATGDVVSILRTAQATAVSTGIDHGVAFTIAAAPNPNTYQLFRGVIAPVAVGPVMTLPNGVTFIGNNFPINAALGLPFAVFTPAASSNAGQIQVNNALGVRTITVGAATGRVHVEE